jgi:hypothetical protein
LQKVLPILCTFSSDSPRILFHNSVHSLVSNATPSATAATRRRTAANTAISRVRGIAMSLRLFAALASLPVGWWDMQVLLCFNSLGDPPVLFDSEPLVWAQSIWYTVIHRMV